MTVQHPVPRKSKSRQAFTLIELLVVISIITVLIALLLPTLQNARATARRVKCLSQQRQIAMAHTAYATNNNGYFYYLPTGVPYANFPEYWPRVTTTIKEPLTHLGYLATREVFYCPEYLTKFSSYGLASDWYVHRTAYPEFVNAYYTAKPDVKPRPNSRGKRKIDTLSNVRPGQAMLQDIYVVQSNKTRSSHQGGANVVLTDGSGAFVRKKKLSTKHNAPIHYYLPGIWRFYKDLM